MATESDPRRHAIRIMIPYSSHHTGTPVASMFAIEVFLFSNLMHMIAAVTDFSVCLDVVLCLGVWVLR